MDYDISLLINASINVNNDLHIWSIEQRTDFIVTVTSMIQYRNVWSCLVTWTSFV